MLSLENIEHFEHFSKHHVHWKNKKFCYAYKPMALKMIKTPFVVYFLCNDPTLLFC